MKTFFRWLSPPNGNCPVQAEGWFLGYFFYFRARHSLATIEFYHDKGCFYNDYPVKMFELKETGAYQAGWLPKRTCRFLVYKGCFKFFFTNILFANTPS